MEIGALFAMVEGRARAAVRGQVASIASGHVLVQWTGDVRVVEVIEATARAVGISLTGADGQDHQIVFACTSDDQWPTLVSVMKAFALAPPPNLP